MPVVMTMTIIALLRSRASGDLPFFDPALLRELLAQGLQGEPEELLAEAIALADELDTLIERYSANVDSTIDAYIESAGDPRADAADLSERLASIDRRRSVVMSDIIRIRRSLVDLLADDQWQAVFD